MSATTFSQHHIVPSGRAMLAFSCLLPDGWVMVPIPHEEYDLDNPGVFIPLVVCMAQYGVVIFTVAARPAFDDGSVQDWAEYLAAQQQMQVERVLEARVNRMPCIRMDATMASDAGPMRSRSVFLEDGRRLYNIGALAPQAIWGSVEADFDRMLGSFTLDEVHGITAAPLRLMTSEPAIDLSAQVHESSRVEPPAAWSPADANDDANTEDRADAEVADDADSNAGADADAQSEADDTPARAIDVATADDAGCLDPELPINVRLRDAGAGLVPRVLGENDEEKYAIVGAGAIEQLFHVPYGWHVVDDGKRTLVFHTDAGVQISLNLRSIGEDGVLPLLEAIGDELARDHPQALFLRMTLLDMPCLAVRDIVIEGEELDQAYLARPSHRPNLALVCRVTAARDEIERGMNAAEVVLRSCESPPSLDPEFAGQPDWWRDAVLLERSDRLEEAEQTILAALDHIGVYSQLAHLYELRVGRLQAEGRDADAANAKARAIHWLYAYAGSATSGGEGAALSYERDQRIAALGGED